MNIYLAIITTVLVLTQIVRLIQNAMQLRKYNWTNRQNDYLVSVYEKIDRYITGKLEGF